MTDLDRAARKTRILSAALRGIRAVPADPDPDDFPFVPFACDLRPFECPNCHVTRCLMYQPSYDPRGVA